MLFMVIEHFKNADARPIGERFKRQGRMLPDGVTYHSSWVHSAGDRCFQLMEAPNEQSLAAWATRWEDLIDFEIVPVLSSQDFWARVEQGGERPAQS
jgi:hypothetical protein